MQELIEAEASEVIGAGRYERTETRVTDRNGSRPRLVTTQAGDVQLRIPKLRKGSFFPTILEPRRRIDQALYAVVMEAYGTLPIHWLTVVPIRLDNAVTRAADGWPPPRRFGGSCVNPSVSPSTCGMSAAIPSALGQCHDVGTPEAV